MLEYHESRADDLAEGIEPSGEGDEEPVGTSGKGGDDEGDLPDGPGAEADDAEEAGGAGTRRVDGSRSGAKKHAGDGASVEDEDHGGDDGDGEEDGVAGSGDSLRLSGEDCRALRAEALQYYHRYIALMVLEDYDGVIRDTTRNLRVLDLLREHAATPSDRVSLEPNRPYILMMRARASASQALRDQEAKAAVLAIDEGLEALKQWFDAHAEDGAFEQSREVQVLQAMREALVPKLPISQKGELRRRLNEAIMSENYELAAILRDELKMLPGD